MAIFILKRQALVLMFSALSVLGQVSRPAVVDSSATASVSGPALP